MINAKELRIGNLVYEDETIHEWNIYDYTLNQEFYSPIPLTPEILIACGFVAEQSADMDERNIWSIQVANNTSLYYDPDLDNKHWYLSYFYNNNHYQNDFWGCPEYLHQLQNLFYSLAGEELSYTPLTQTIPSETKPKD